MGETAPNFVPPPSPPPVEKPDYFAELLQKAVENKAKEEAQRAIRESYVDRGTLNDALLALKDDLKTTLITDISAALVPQLTSTVQTTVDQLGIRKGTIVTPEAEFEANPVAFVLKKGREQGPESFTDEEKRLIWGLTYHALGKGLEEGDE